MLASLARPVQVRAGERATGRSAAVTANRGGPIGQSIGPSPTATTRGRAHSDPPGRVPMKMGSRWLVAPVLLGADRSGRRPGDWTTYGGNDWNQRYSTLKIRSTPSNVVAADRPGMMFQTGITKLGSFENTPIVIGRGHVRDHALQHGDGVRPELRARSSGGTSTSWAPPSSAAVRTIVVSRSTAAPTSTWEPWTPGSSRSTPRPARCCGTRKSPTRPSATASRTLRSSSATT